MSVDTATYHPTSNGVTHMNGEETKISIGDAEISKGDEKFSSDICVKIINGDAINGIQQDPYGFPGATFDVAFFDLARPEEFIHLSHYDGFHPGTTILKKGHVKAPGLRPLPCDMIYERDVGLKMRDGCTLYTDVFRPAGNDKVPAILPQ